MKVLASKPTMLLGEGVIRVEVEGVLDQATLVVRLHGVGAERALESHLAAGCGPFREPQGLLSMSLRAAVREPDGWGHRHRSPAVVVAAAGPTTL